MAAKKKTAKKKAGKKSARSGGASVRGVLEEARKVGGRVAHAVAETPELIQVTRNDRAFRAEMDDHYRAIGKRVLSLHKRARGESPFVRFKAIMKELEALGSLEDEYRSNRVRLSELRKDVRRATKL